MGAMPDTVFTNARVFDGFRHLGERRRRRRRRRTGRGVGGSTATRPAATVVDVAAAACSCRASPTRTSIPSRAGSSGSTCDLSGSAARQRRLSRARRDYADAHRDLDWIQGGGWAMAAFPGGLPTARALDDVVADRPVALVNRDHHGMWVNSAARCEVAGITAGTPDPADGRIERDRRRASRPASSTRARWTSLAGVLPTADDDQMYAGFLEGQRYLHSLGDHRLAGRDRRCLLRHAGRGPTYARARPAATSRHRWSGRCGGTASVGASRSPSSSRGGGVHARAGSRRPAVKIMQDGVAENGTAALVEPYLDRCGHATTNSGISFVDPGRAARHVGELDDHGFQVHVHGLGDRGVREALDALEGTDPDSPAPRRAPPARAPRRRRRGSRSSASRRTSRRSGPATTTR